MFLDIFIEKVFADFVTQDLKIFTNVSEKLISSAAVRCRVLGVNEIVYRWEEFRPSIFHYFQPGDFRNDLCGDVASQETWRL